MASNPYAKLKQNGTRCLYHRDLLDYEQATALLAKGPEGLLEGSAEIYRTSNAVSFRASLDDRSVFIKELRPRQGHKRLADLLTPATFRKLNR